MKKTVLTFLLLFALGQVFAQRQVRLPERPNNRPAYVDHSELDNGFWCAVEATGGTSFLLKDGVDDAQRVGFSVVGGYMVNEFLKLGLGMGGNCYVNNNDQLRSTSIKWTMPVYIDLRGNLLSQEVRNFVPYWSLDIGGAVRDGFFFSPTIGMKFGEKRDSWLLGFNCCIQQIKNWTDKNKQFSPHGKETPEMTSIFSIKVGYEF